MRITTVPIKGMHCRSCELLIEEELKTVTGVKKVSVSQNNSCAEIYHEEKFLNSDEIQKAIEQAGYKIGVEEKKTLIFQKQ